MRHENVTLKLPEKMLVQAQTLAARQDVSIGQLVRGLLRREIDRRLNPKTPNRADEGLVAALQALLATQMAVAEGWSDLAFRLAQEGYELRPAGGGLTLHKRRCGTRLCKASELGFSYRSLVKRFRGGMPGHPQGALDVTFERPILRQSDQPSTAHDLFGRIEVER